MPTSFENGELVALAADLAGAPAKAYRRAQLVVQKSTADVKRGGQRNAPVDTGNLRSSISGTTQGLVGTIGPTAEYGGYVENGTSRMAPQPYMAPALEAVAPSFTEAIAALAEETLDG